MIKYLTKQGSVKIKRSFPIDELLQRTLDAMKDREDEIEKSLREEIS